MGKRNADHGDSVTRDAVLNLYIGEDLSRREVARILGIKKPLITSTFADLGIADKRTVEGFWLRISRDELRRLYVTEGVSMKKLLKRLHVSRATLKPALMSLGIEIRGQYGAKEAGRYHEKYDQTNDSYKRSRRQTAERRALSIAADWRTGLYDFARIRKKYGVKEWTISRYLKMQGIKGTDKRYRDRAILAMYNEGKSVADLRSIFDVGRRVIRRVLIKGGINLQYSQAYPVKLPRSLCPVCGREASAKPAQEYCSRACCRAFMMLDNLDRNLEMLRASRGGESVVSLARRYDMAVSTARSITNGRFPVVAIVETLIRHTRGGALTAFARQEVRSAWRSLRSLGLAVAVDRKYGGKLKKV